MKSKLSIVALVGIAPIVMVLTMCEVEALRGVVMPEVERENLFRNIQSFLSSFVASLPRVLLDFMFSIFNAIIGILMGTTAPTTTSATTATSTSTVSTTSSTSATATTTVTSTSSRPPSAKLVFLTSTLYQGNFGGIEGGDDICNYLAMDEGINGTFAAWLSNATVSPSTRFVNNSCPYIRYDNEIVASSFQSLLDNGPDISISITEEGDEMPPELVWTNTENLGGVRAGNNDCNGWTSNSVGLRPTMGRTGSTTTWSYSGNLFVDCNSIGRLYCFEQ